MFKRSLIIVCILITGLMIFTSCVDNHVHKYVDGICNCGDRDPNYKEVNCALDRDNELCLDSSSWNWDYNKTNWDGKGMVIEIAVSKIEENDPFSENYKGERKEEKQALISKIEAEYNIDIVYILHGVDYKSVANRMKNKMGDIFLVNSSMIPTLKNNDLVVELYDLQSKTGIFTEYNYSQDDNYNLMSFSNNKVYGYQNGKPIPDHWLFYNQNLIDEFNLKDPAKMWNDGQWTWSNFLDFLEQAKIAFDQDSSELKNYVFGGDCFEVAKGLIAARGGRFVENETVLLDSEEVVEVYEDLCEIQTLYWESVYVSDVISLFRDGEILFQTGKIDYIDNPERWAYLDFSISAVPYPRSDSDTNLEQYQVPLSYEDMYVIRKLDNEENGLTESILFNIIDDITNGLIPLKNEKSYSDYLEEKIDSEESIKAILSLISDRYNQTYLEMIDVLSLTMGDGSHYAINGIYPQSRVIIVRKDDVPEVILNKLQVVYQEELDKLLGKNVNN